MKVFYKVTAQSFESKFPKNRVHGVATQPRAPCFSAYSFVDELLPKYLMVEERTLSIEGYTYQDHSGRENAQSHATCGQLLLDK